MKLSKPIFVVSNRADDLTEALKKSSQTITIWIRSGKYKDKFPIIRSVITYEAKSNIDAKDYTRRFISIFCIPKTHTKLSVLKGISNREIRQLLIYTKRGKFERVSTHDVGCFRTKKTFLSWKVRGKIIYTLINRSGKLLGIIWFNKGKRTIRIYPPAKGKNVEKKFLEIVRKNYFARSRLSGSVSKNR